MAILGKVTSADSDKFEHSLVQFGSVPLPPARRGHPYIVFSSARSSRRSPPPGFDVFGEVSISAQLGLNYKTLSGSHSSDRLRIDKSKRELPDSGLLIEIVYMMRMSIRPYGSS